MDIEMEMNGKGKDEYDEGLSSHIQAIIESDEFNDFISNLDEGSQKKVKDVFEMLQAYCEENKDGKERDREMYGKPQMKNKMKGNMDIGEGEDDLKDYVMVVQKRKMMFPKEKMMRE